MTTTFIAAQVMNMLAIALTRDGVSSSVPRYLDIVGALILQGGRAYSDLVALRAQIEQMVEENRAPDASEWDVWLGRSSAAHGRIQDVDLSDPAVPA